MKIAPNTENQGLALAILTEQSAPSVDAGQEDPLVPAQAFLF